MKSLVIIMGFLFCISHTEAQDRNYKVVFDMTSADTVNHQAVIRQVSSIKEANPGAQLEVVIYGQGLGLVTNETPQQPAITRLLNEQGISFKVCAETMKRYKVDKAQLIPGVEVVPDGIYEIISKQREGWGYIKVGH